jgi:uncharacterized membrane protein
MLARVLASRWRHLVWLTPLGAVVGLGFGVLFHDVVYGLLVGCALGLLFGFMFVVRHAS